MESERGCQAGWRAPRRAPGSPCLREGPYSTTNFTVVRAKPLVAWRVSGSLTPPFHTLHVARRKREGRGMQESGQALSQQARVVGPGSLWVHVLLSPPGS